MTRYICSECSTQYEVTLDRWKCECGGVLDLLKETPKIDRAQWDETGSLWRYRQVMPIEDDEWRTVTLGEGRTPLVVLSGDIPDTYVKVDYMMPTLSFKDRGAAVLMAKAKALGAGKVIQDSSGNAGTSIAAYAARSGIECDIYLSDATSPKKVAQIRAHGANVVQISGTREDIADAARAAVESERVFYASHVYNPYFYEGTKTYAYEIYESLGKAPDALIIPVGNGTLLLGAYYGFRELMENGLIERMPKIIAVQAANCAPLAEAFRRGHRQAEAVANEGTLAEGIAIGRPARSKQILEAVRDTGGDFIRVAEAEIADARKALADRGFYVEITSAANYAGYLKYDGTTEESIIIPLCGAGIKSE